MNVYGIFKRLLEIESQLTDSYQKNIISIWRERIFLIIFFSATVFGTFNYIITIVDAIQEGWWMQFIAYTFALLLVLCLLFIRKIPFIIRSWGGLMLFFFLGIFSLISFGMNGGGRTYLFAFSIVACLLLGLKGGVIALIMNTLSIILIGWLIRNGSLDTLAKIPHSKELLFYFITTFIWLNVIVTLALGIMVRALEKSLIKGQNYTKELNTINLELKKEIIERKQAEQALKESEEKLESIINESPFPIAVADANDEKILYWSSNAKKMFGHSPKTVSKWFELAYPDEGYRKKVTERYKPHFNKLQETGKSINTGEYEIRSKDGSVKICEIHAQLIQNNLIITFNDITERKKAETEIIKAKEKAIESKTQLELITNNFVKGMIYQVAMLDENRRQFNYISKNVKELYGCTVQEAKEDANLVYGKLHPDDVAELIEKEKEALRNMSPFEAEARTINSNGDIRWAYYISKPRIVDGVPCWDGIEIDITERKQMELELIKAKEKAEESDQLKSAFLANMSHEIRTPMNGILGFTELLKEPELSGEERNKFIEIIRKSGNRMLNTVNDIIDISKIDSGQIEVSKTNVNINKEIESLFDFFIGEASAKGLEIKLINDLANQSIIFTDKPKLNSIISNLIKNAIKYTDKGSIVIHCNKKGANLEFSITDTGIGISKNRIQSIFNRFEQADIKDTHAREGSGLGLSITKAYVEMLGGNIGLESEKEKGSTFYFTIPWIEKQEKPKPIIEKEEKNTASHNQINILIAEDEDFSFEYLKIILNNRANRIDRVITGKEAIEYMQKNNDTDVILMDAKMPVINGYQATTEIRKFNEEVVIIAQTAYALEGDRENALAVGCNDYIPKPINSKLLLEMINKHMEK